MNLPEVSRIISGCLLGLKNLEDTILLDLAVAVGGRGSLASKNSTFSMLLYLSSGQGRPAKQ